MTNYEKIKSMSVDEMAEFLENTTSIVAIKLNGEYVCTDKNYIKQWLESKAEPKFCTDKENKLRSCEDCHLKECES